MSPVISVPWPAASRRERTLSLCDALLVCVPPARPLYSGCVAWVVFGQVGVWGPGVGMSGVWGPGAVGREGWPAPSPVGVACLGSPGVSGCVCARRVRVCPPSPVASCCSVYSSMQLPRQARDEPPMPLMDSQV